MLPQLHDYILAHWHDLPVTGSRPTRLHFMGQATGVSKVCFFIFADGSRAPRGIVKMPRSPVYNTALLHEVATIERLRELVSPALRATLPGPMHAAQVANQQLVIEPVLPGRSLEHRHAGTEQAAIEAQLDLAFHWLVQVQREAAPYTHELDAALIQQYFLEPLADVKRSMDLTPAEAGLVDQLAEQARGLIGCAMPLVLYHGDFRAGNILVDRQRIAVLDWEFSRPLAPPLLDWFSFVFRVFSRAINLPDIDGSLDQYRLAFREVFFARNWFSQLVGEYTRAYCRELGVDEAHLPLLLGLFLTTSINKFNVFLHQRAGRGYLYLLQDHARSVQSYERQLRRQAYTWLLGELAVMTGPACWSEESP